MTQLHSQLLAFMRRNYFRKWNESFISQREYEEAADIVLQLNCRQYNFLSWFMSRWVKSHPDLVHTDMEIRKGWDMARKILSHSRPNVLQRLKKE